MNVENGVTTPNDLPLVDAYRESFVEWALSDDSEWWDRTSAD